MKAKQEYIDALERMTKEYYSTVRTPEECNKFNSYLRLFKGLVNEHFEEKKETNLDYYKHEILEDCLWDLAVVKGIPKLCNKTNCSDCDFKNSLKECHKKIIDWLKQPYIKPTYKLTQFEKELLECYSDVYSFKVFNSLNGMKEKGYFKGIDDNELIGDILAKCEVVG